jgi:hypothetical protein
LFRCDDCQFFLSVAVIVGEKLGLRAKADDAGRCRALPEFVSLPRVRVCVCVESQIKNSLQRWFCREPNKKLPAKKKLSAKRPVCRELTKKLSAKNKTLGTDFFAESQMASSRQRNFKKLLFDLQSFSILNIHLYKTYTQI